MSTDLARLTTDLAQPPFDADTAVLPEPDAGGSYGWTHMACLDCLIEFTIFMDRRSNEPCRIGVHGVLGCKCDAYVINVDVVHPVCAYIPLTRY